jgi:hypothetical protein
VRYALHVLSIYTRVTCSYVHSHVHISGSLNKQQFLPSLNSRSLDRSFNLFFVPIQDSFGPSPPLAPYCLSFWLNHRPGKVKFCLFYFWFLSYKVGSVVSAQIILLPLVAFFDPIPDTVLWSPKRSITSNQQALACSDYKR